MSASAPPRNSTPCGRMIAPLPVLLSAGEDVQQKGVVAVLRRAERRTRSGRTRLRPGLKPLLHALMENGGLATTKSKVLSAPSCSLKCGLARMLSCQISAVGQSCRIMFILASAAVALSISWP